jgi:hypothetical protein
MFGEEYKLCSSSLCNLEAAIISEMLVTFNQTTRNHNTEDSNILIAFSFDESITNEVNQFRFFCSNRTFSFSQGWIDEGATGAVAPEPEKLLRRLLL